jgi:hypothetical protein
MRTSYQHAVHEAKARAECGARHLVRAVTNGVQNSDSEVRRAHEDFAAIHALLDGGEPETELHL